jgi:hypothetical protein
MLFNSGISHSKDVIVFGYKALGHTEKISGGRVDAVSLWCFSGLGFLTGMEDIPCFATSTLCKDSSASSLVEYAV